MDFINDIVSFVSGLSSVEMSYLFVVLFMFALATIDLTVGVSNDAVNFLSAAVGSKAAKLKHVLIVAAVGVFVGAACSSGMMDVARNGIFDPVHFTFANVMCIYLAVVISDVFLLDLFNSLGLPTSTTVSMVFELLGASFITAILSSDTGLSTLNTDKALTIIISIFLSVAVAFVFGLIVQWISRLVFTFHYKKNLGRKIGIYGGFASTAIIYFMLVKGLKGSKLIALMPAGVSEFIYGDTMTFLLVTFAVCTVLMQLLHLMKVNVLKIVVLMGTFSLAMAFAGNDLVNFIGVPLAGLASFTDFVNSGVANPNALMMTSLLESASTPFVYLLIAGVVMVVALATSKKAHTVLKTSIDLSSKNEGDEMFGSSRTARSMVRWSNSLGNAIVKIIPERTLRYIDSRFVAPEVQDNTVAYDLLRASVNLVMASLLIALGTSFKLPLSTTFVTFMVAMGTSLADRAWTRESAVFRITGVITVIGGWFITAGVAFAAGCLVAGLMNYGGWVVVFALIAVGLYSLFRSHMGNEKDKEMQEGDLLFQEILKTTDRDAVLSMLERHIGICSSELVFRYSNCLRESTDGLFTENLRTLRKTTRLISLTKREIKNLRRREAICLRRVEPSIAVRLSTDFHLVHNSLRQILYGLLRLTEPALDHVDNNFTPIDKEDMQRYVSLRLRAIKAMEEVATNLRLLNFADNDKLRATFEQIREDLRTFRHEVLVNMQKDGTNLSTLTLLVHVIQETEQICAEMTDLAHFTVRLDQSSHLLK